MLVIDCGPWMGYDGIAICVRTELEPMDDPERQAKCALQEVKRYTPDQIRSMDGFPSGWEEAAARYCFAIAQLTGNPIPVVKGELYGPTELIGTPLCFRLEGCKHFWVSATYFLFFCYPLTPCRTGCRE